MSNIQKPTSTKRVNSAKTLVERAKREVPGFKAHYAKFEEQTLINGYAPSTIFNYSRAVAKISLHFKKSLLDLAPSEVNQFLYVLAKEKTANSTYFKHAVYGLRFFFRLYDMEDRVLQMPTLSNNRKLPVVLSAKDLKGLFSAPQRLKHRVIFCLIYSAGLRISELTNLKISGKDSQHMTIRVAKRKGKYLYPQKALASIFRAKFVEQVRKEVVIPSGVAKLIFSKPWIVYAKQPFNTPKTVVEYLGRYTHKVAISNHRIKSINDDYVNFSYKDYRDNNKTKIMRLTPFEFMRRFQQHILPKGFTRMRHYGILASRNKPKELNIAKTYFGLEAWKQVKITWLELTITKLGINPYKCTSCAKGMMEITQIITSERGPPTNKDLRPNQNFYKKNPHLKTLS